MTERFDAVIVGAGFAGLATARALRARGCSVIVLERRPGLEPEGSGIAIQPRGFDALDRLGLLDRALALGRPFTVVEQCDARGRVTARMDYAALGHRFAQAMTVRRSELIEVMADGVPIRFGVRVSRLTRDARGVVDGVALTDADGRERQVAGTWVIGADGRASKVRQLAGIRSRGTARAERYVVGLVDGRPLRDVGRLYCGHGWADGVLPHPGRLYFFDFVNAENARAVAQRDFDAWAAVYAQRTPDAAHVLAHVSSFDDLSVLCGRPHVALPRVRGRTVLAGDAAASVHPHAGQGANFALEDGAALGAAIASGDARAVVRHGRRQDLMRARYVPYSVVAGRTLDGTRAGWRLLRAAGDRAGRVPGLRRRMLQQHLAV